MKKEIQPKSSAGPHHQKPPAHTQSSSKNNRRFKPIRRIAHRPPSLKAPPPSTLPSNHCAQTLPAPPSLESAADTPSQVNLQHYLDDIDLHMLNIDKSFHLALQQQLAAPAPTTVTLEMRKILVRWLAKVAARFRSKSDTLHMCVQIIDLMLLGEGDKFSKSNFQLLGVASLFISCKYNEICTMEAKKYVEACEGIFTIPQLLQMEGQILLSLGFNLQIPTLHQFTGRLMDVCKVSREHAYVVKSLADMAIFEFQNFNGFRKSEMATAIIYFVAKAYQLEEVKANLSNYKKKVNPDSFKKCFLVVAALFKKSHPTPL